MNKDYEEIEEELEDEMENDDRTDDEYANGYPRRGYTCADCIHSDCDGTLPISKITFPDYISPKKVKEICEAMKSGKVIIIKGSQKATGKTTVTNILKENGFVAFEKFECVEIEI